MSYLKLGNTRINYVSKTTTDPFIFISEVVESNCSYSTPKLISTKEDLDIYFGTSFKQREFYEELLSYESSLLLYRPIKEITESNKYIEEKVIDCFDFLPEDGKIDGRTDWKVYVKTENDYYVWYEGEYIKYSDLPIESNSLSLINRDSLRITDLTFSEKFNLPYCHPRYKSLINKPEYKISTLLTESIKNNLLNSIKNYGVENEDYAICYTLDFSEVEEIKDSDYIVFPKNPTETDNTDEVEFYFNKTLPPLGADVVPKASKRYIEGETLEEKIENIISALKTDYNYIVDDSEKEKKIYTIFQSNLTKDKQFFNIKGLTFEKNFESTQDILSIISDGKYEVIGIDQNGKPFVEKTIENIVRLEFFSKTIGPSDEDIKIKIEKINSKEKERYRVTISRFFYQEIFEGPLYIELDEETQTYNFLEKIINQESKLVEVKIYNTGRDKDNPEDGLSEGEFYLRRATIESYTPEDYWRSLREIEKIEIREDFLLIPEIEKYLIKGSTQDINWYSEYEDLLNYSSAKNCQVLISNHPYNFGCTNAMFLDNFPDNPEEGIMYGIKTSDTNIFYQSFSKKNGWTIYNNDKDSKYRVHEIQESFLWGNAEEELFPFIEEPNYKFNYIKDIDNRLVYFYEDMTFLGYQRPAYYIFLRGVLSGKYQESENRLIYNSPVDPYSEENTNLKSWKSNFLSCNNHIFYYHEFFNHTGDWKYETTILTRFCLDKVTNTVSRDLPYYLGSETSGEVESGLNTILRTLQNKYPIISSLTISGIQENSEKQTLIVILNLQVKEQLEKDVKLSVILNFNYT